MPRTLLKKRIVSVRSPTLKTKCSARRPDIFDGSPPDVLPFDGRLGEHRSPESEWVNSADAALPLLSFSVVALSGPIFFFDSSK